MTELRNLCFVPFQGEYHDYKTDLQEKSRLRFGVLPEYKVIRREGEEHRLRPESQAQGFALRLMVLVRRLKTPHVIRRCRKVECRGVCPGGNRQNINRILAGRH